MNGFYLAAILLLVLGIIFACIPQIYDAIMGFETGEWNICYLFMMLSFVSAFICIGFGSCARAGEQKIAELKQEHTEFVAETYANDEIPCAVKTVDAMFDKVILTKESYEAFVNGKADFVSFLYEDQPVVANASNIEYIKVLKLNKEK